MNLEQFMKKVKIMPNGCWEWIGLSKKDYGWSNFCWKRIRAHCLAFVIFKGPIPKGLMVCHSCDNKPCANPKHLYLGTNKKNIQDAVSRGLIKVGQDSHSSKITKLAATNIRKVYAAKKSRRWGGKELAEKYGISRAEVTQIAKGNRWKSAL